MQRQDQRTKEEKHQANLILIQNKRLFAAVNKQMKIHIFCSGFTQDDFPFFLVSWRVLGTERFFAPY